MKLKENTKEYACVYGHRFKGMDVKLIAFRNPSEKILGHVTFTKGPDIEPPYYKGGKAKEGYLLACPICGIVQLGGFALQTGEQLARKDQEVGRAIELSL